ncbi:nucleoside triphosphate pyrophosphohydrolase [Salibacter sp.]|uniref:nucleoside triphosphate pyrophosphohydrolase n=1 Tax=Salibacter sp. TaxID=2010995 RepID=UPI00287077AB|nr:nucleoside triphosphate pyrophosphohydrolase [Salibacter sp.]MDR9398918.1 nucleoside triphosphate pyrophosphohydrolase [Salibacter sp.]MDR9487165.1 nucleoside triphosphate pyrophosphohydrolase [Salibacter sp.]
MATIEEKKEAFERLLNIMDDLREGCPWDRKQTLDSLRYLTIEETYELSDAILSKDYDELKGEIGDIMLHMVFYSKIASEKNEFDVADVLNAICDKLVHRHPHIYGDVEAKTEEEVKANWEELKLKEGKKSVLQGVPKSLPAVVKASRIQEKVKGVGFDWDNKDQVWDKVQEEIQEFREEEKNGNKERMEEEFGDLMFSLINYARFIGVNPEDALEKTNRKFIKRFQYLEEKTNSHNQSLKEMSLEEMDAIWQEAKKK